MAKKKLLLIGIPVVLLLGGGAAYVFLFQNKADHGAIQEQDLHADSGHGGGHDDGHGDAHAEGQPVFYTLPDIVVNLNSAGKKRGNFLKIKINLELQDKSYIATVEKMLPRIIDNLQIYLRELRVEDIQGSEGLYRLREEMLHRVNMAAGTARVNDVLFAEMLMQ